MFTIDDLLNVHEELTAGGREIMKRKNHDYASVQDPFRNFRMFGSFGVLVRMSDKIARLRSFEENGEFKVADESVRDTIIDLINYGIIYYAIIHEKDIEQAKTVFVAGKEQAEAWASPYNLPPQEPTKNAFPAFDIDNPDNLPPIPSTNHSKCYHGPLAPDQRKNQPDIIEGTSKHF